MYRTIIRTGLLLLAAATAAAAPAVDGTAPGSAGEEDSVSPEVIDGVTKLNAEGLIEKVMDMPQLVLIDSRISADRKEGFIEGSISLPDTETSCTTLGKVVPRKDSPVLFYCNGVRCGRSARAASIARDCGYTSIFWFRKGMEEWQEKQYPLVQ